MSSYDNRLYNIQRNKCVHIYIIKSMKIENLDREEYEATLKQYSLFSIEIDMLVVLVMVVTVLLIVVVCHVFR